MHLITTTGKKTNKATLMAACCDSQTYDIIFRNCAEDFTFKPWKYSCYGDMNTWAHCQSAAWHWALREPQSLAGITQSHIGHDILPHLHNQINGRHCRAKALRTGCFHTRTEALKCSRDVTERWRMSTQMSATFPLSLPTFWGEFSGRVRTRWRKNKQKEKD